MIYLAKCRFCEASLSGGGEEFEDFQFLTIDIGWAWDRKGQAYCGQHAALAKRA